MRSYYSFRVLADLDPQCSEYISVYSGQVATLGQTVRQGGGSGKSDGSGTAMSASLAELSLIHIYLLTIRIITRTTAIQTMETRDTIQTTTSQIMADRPVHQVLPRVPDSLTDQP